METTLYQHCTNVVQRCFDVVSTLFQRRAPTLYQRCATLKIRRRILFHFQRRINVISTLIHNVETMLIRRWNVGWDLFSRGSINGLFWKLSKEVFLEKSCKPDGVKSFNSVRKILSHRYLSVNLEKFLEKLFHRTPPSNHFSHDVVFFSFADQWGLQPKISSFGVAMVNHGKQFTNHPFNPV